MVSKPNRDVGIVGYGAYVPRYRLPGSEVDRVWKDGEAESPVEEKAVPGPDEDTATMSIEAARNALAIVVGTHVGGRFNGPLICTALAMRGRVCVSHTAIIVFGHEPRPAIGVP